MKKTIGIILSIGVVLVSCTQNPSIMRNTTASNTDCHFMTQAAYAYIGMEATAQLAGQKARYGGVATLGAELGVDYQAAHNELKEICTDLKYSIPSTANRQQLESELQLLHLSGKEFDTAYIGMQIRNNLAMIDLFEVEANGGHDPSLKRYALKYLQVIKRHVYRSDSVLAVVQNNKYPEDMPLALAGQ